ncbi:MAG: MBL fold metallo-hydrolase [Acidimicrobiia bacterium]
MLNVSFFGVRGSTPCAGDETRRYGGNTACVALERPGHEPILFDIGTGLRYFGDTQPRDGSFRGTALVSHLHWDHVQGLPFFVPILRDGAQFDLYGPTQDDGSTLEDAFATFMRPPFFPVQVEMLPGVINFHTADDSDFAVGDAKVMSRHVPHVGRTNGYRVTLDGSSVAYISDHQQPADRPNFVDNAVLELADNTDVLIHDAQYTPDEFRNKATWGHCTIDYAITVARAASAKRLVLFHHDPEHHDDVLDELALCARRVGDKIGIEILTASEGLTVSLD